MWSPQPPALTKEQSRLVEVAEADSAVTDWMNVCYLADESRTFAVNNSVSLGCQWCPVPLKVIKTLSEEGNQEPFLSSYPNSCGTGTK